MSKKSTRLIVSAVFISALVFSFGAIIQKANANSYVQNCIVLNSDLKVGSVDRPNFPEVGTLQYFLAGQGFGTISGQGFLANLPSPLLPSDPYGHFEKNTLEAVKLFQRQYQIPQTGYVGPLTRAKISLLTCNVVDNNANAPTISSLSPNSGPVGASVTITGTNFTAKNTVNFGDQIIGDLDSSDGGTKITFTVPNTTVTKNQVSVSNSRGVSDLETFSVTGLAGEGPTATLTINGQTDTTLHVGDQRTYTWSSTGATSWSSDYTKNCDDPKTSHSWIINNQNGLSGQDEGVVAAQPDCVVTINYVAQSSNGRRAVATIIVRIVPATTDAPTATLTIDNNDGKGPVHEATVVPGDHPTYQWSSTNAGVFNSYYTNSCDIGASPVVHDWIANSSSGQSVGNPNASDNGCTFTITYRVARADRSPAIAEDTIIVHHAAAITPVPTKTPKIRSIKPNKGAVGIEVTVKGKYFLSTGNNINFENINNFHLNNLPSDDGIIKFIVPEGDDFGCLYNHPACDLPQHITALGYHNVSVSVGSGDNVRTSNSKKFKVTSNNATTTPGAPTAHLTVNGQHPTASHPLVEHVGDANHFEWSSTGGSTYSSSYTCIVPPPDGFFCSDGSNPWVAQNAHGTSDGTTTSAQADYVYTITYTVANSVGTTSDSIVIKILPATNSAGPTISSLDPDSGPVGHGVTIHGTNFINGSTIHFGSSVSIVNGITSPQTTLTTNVPSDIGTGEKQVYVSTSAGESNHKTFNITTTSSGTPTATLTINGHTSDTLNYGDHRVFAWSSTNADRFSSSYTSTCGQSGTWSINQDNGQSGADDGIVANQNPNCTYTFTYVATNHSTNQSVSASITVLYNPSAGGDCNSSGFHICSISPTSGAGGSQVTINGSGFGQNQNDRQVYFVIDSNHGAIGQKISWTPTQIVALVPTGLSAGAHQVQVVKNITTNSPVYSNGVTFTISGQASADFFVALQNLIDTAKSFGQTASINNAINQLLEMLK